jgi:hypothetical protein
MANASLMMVNLQQIYIKNVKNCQKLSKSDPMQKAQLIKQITFLIIEQHVFKALGSLADQQTDF